MILADYSEQSLMQLRSLNYMELLFYWKKIMFAALLQAMHDLDK
jgi:hypothetical protein